MITAGKIHFKSYQHSIIATEQKMSDFCIDHFSLQTCVPAVHIPALGQVPLTGCASTVKTSCRAAISVFECANLFEYVARHVSD